MTDTTSDDVYTDPDNILANTDDSVDGSIELPDAQTNHPSQSIFVPERGQDVRGRIDELEGASEDDARNEMTNGHPEDIDTDSTHLADVDPKDEHDGRQ